MTFPTIEAAATHLGTSQSALIHQFRRLERDIGAPLYQASAPGKPMQPTRRGTTLLTTLDRRDIQALAMEHAPDVSGPASSPGHKHPAPGLAATAAQQAAPLFRALAEPTRLAILLTLQDGERHITDLAARTRRHPVRHLLPHDHPQRLRPDHRPFPGPLGLLPPHPAA